VANPLSGAVVMPVRNHFLRWVGLGSLLLVELLLLSLRIDTGDFVGSDVWWAQAVLHSSEFITALLAVAGATALIAFSGSHRAGSGPLQRNQPAPPLEPPPSATRSWVLLTGHLASFLIFSVLAIRLVAGGADHSLGWLIACVAVGALSTVLLAGVALPYRSWIELLTRARGLLVLGCLIGLVAWAVGALSYSLVAPLWRPTLASVESLLRLAGQELIFRPADQVVGVVGPRGPFAVAIDPSCSGYQGIGLVVVFLSVYLWISRHALRLPRALLLLPIGVAAIWFANVLRITLLILVGGWVSSSIALGGFHSQAGWLAFLAIVLGLVALVQRGGFFLADKEVVDSENPTAAYLMPFLSIIGVTLLTHAVSSGFDALYPLGVIVGGAVLWHYWRGNIPGHWRSIWSGRAALFGVAAFVVWILVKAFLIAEVEEPGTAAALAQAPPVLAAFWLVFRLGGTILLAPVVEELAFRGYLMRRLISRDFDQVPHGTFTWTSFLLSSMVFGGLHASWLAGLLAGMIFALAYCRRGRLTDAVLAHATCNTLVALIVLATGRWGFL
jgi:exosortase E/protease (VPEID-CTERM system)